MLGIADLDLKAEGAVRAGAKNIICPYVNVMEYYAPGHTPVRGATVVGVAYAIELLPMCLHLPAGGMTSSAQQQPRPSKKIKPSEREETHQELVQRARVGDDLDVGCAFGRFWGPMYYNRPNEAPRGWRQEVLIVCVPARKDTKADQVVVASYCSDVHVDALNDAREWAQDVFLPPSEGST